MDASIPTIDSPAKATQFTGAVLVGGSSTRMQTDKAFLRVGNQFLIERQLNCVRETGASELLISGRTDVDYSTFGTSVIYDGQLGLGPLAGLAALLGASSCPMLLVLAVDMPAMEPGMLAKILSQSNEKSGCVPVDPLGFQPLAAVYPRGSLALAEHRLASGDFSMEGFVRAAITEGLVRPLQIETRDMAYFANWNHPADWEPPSII